MTAAFYLIPLLFPPLTFLFTCFAFLPLYYIGLSSGASTLLGSGLIASLLILIAPQLSILFLCFSVLPAYILSAVVLRYYSSELSEAPICWYPAGLLVSWATAIGLGYFTLAFLISGPEFPALKTIYLDIWTTYNKQSSTKIDQQFIEQTYEVLPGILTLSYVALHLLNMRLAQALLTAFHKNIRPYPISTDLQYHNFWDIPFLIGFFIKFLPFSFLKLYGENLQLICSLPLFLAGLKYVLSYFQNIPYAHFWKIFLYIAIILFAWPIGIMVIIGILHPFSQEIQKYFLKKQ